MFDLLTRALPFALFSTTIFASACLAPEVRTMEVLSHQEPCVGVGVGLCMIVDDDFFYDGIEGFTYAWGHTSVLEVEVTPVANPPADGSSVAYTLIDTISDERVAEGTAFTFPVVAAELIERDDDGAFHIMSGGPRIDCETNALCDALESGLPVDDGCVDLTLAHPASDDAPLVLTAVADSTDDRCGTL